MASTDENRNALHELKRSAQAYIANSPARTPVPVQEQALQGLLTELRQLVRLRPEIADDASLSEEADGLALDIADVARELILAGRRQPNTQNTLRELCIGSLRLRQSDVAGLLAQSYQGLLWHDTSARESCLRDLGLLACLALKEGQPHVATCAVPIVLEGMLLTNREDENAELLEHTGAQALEAIAATAARRCVERVVQQVARGAFDYAARRGQVLNAGAWSGLVLDLLFSVAQGRLARTTNDVGRLALQLAGQDLPAGAMQAFMTDWAVHTAQVLRRGWLDVAQPFMRAQCLLLCRLRSQELTQACLASLAPHFVMIAKWENVAVAAGAYAPWFQFGCVLLDLCLAAERYRVSGGDDSAMWLHAEATRRLGRALIGTLAVMMTNTSRLTHQDELVVYKAWATALDAYAEGHDWKRKRLRRLVQMTAQYWHDTQRSSSHLQWPELQAFLAPSQLDATCLALLKRVE